MLSKMTYAPSLTALSLAVLEHAGGCSALKLSASSVSGRVSARLRDKVAAAQGQIDPKDVEPIRQMELNAPVPPKGAHSQFKQIRHLRTKNVFERMNEDITQRQRKLPSLDKKADELAWRKNYEETKKRLEQELEDLKRRFYLKPLKDMTSVDILALLSKNGGITPLEEAKLRTLADLNDDTKFMSLHDIKHGLSPHNVLPPLTFEPRTEEEDSHDGTNTAASSSVPPSEAGVGPGADAEAVTESTLASGAGAKDDNDYAPILRQGAGRPLAVVPSVLEQARKDAENM